MDPPSQQRKSRPFSTRQEARMPTRRGPTWETEKELQMQQALHESLERAGGMEKTQQAKGWPRCHHPGCWNHCDVTVRCHGDDGPCSRSPALAWEQPWKQTSSACSRSGWRFSAAIHYYWSLWRLTLLHELLGPRFRITFKGELLPVCFSVKVEGKPFSWKVTALVRV